MTSSTRPASSTTNTGPHIFHTNSEQVVDYLSQFTEWRPYEHRVLALRPRPAGADPDQPDDAQQAVRPRSARPTRKRPTISPRAPSRSTTSAPPKTSSSTPSGASSTSCSSTATRASSGASTRRELDKSVTARIPTRTNTDDRYFTDKFQAMPLRWLHRDVRADARQPADREAARHRFPRRRATRSITDHLIYTGPIDEYFDFRFGKLPYRSLKFEHKTLDQEQFQEVGTVNYPAEDLPLHADQRV